MNKRDAKVKAEYLTVEEAQNILDAVEEKEKLKISKVNKLFTKHQTFEMMQAAVNAYRKDGSKTLHSLPAKNLLIDFA